MVQEHHVKGYDNFCEFMKRFTQTDLVHVFFSGDKLPSGESWCSDCVRGEVIFLNYYYNVLHYPF